MLESVLLLFLGAALLFAWNQRGKWRQRARAAEDQNKANRKAHDIQNDVLADPRYRERVRRRFDQP